MCVCVFGMCVCVQAKLTRWHQVVSTWTRDPESGEAVVVVTETEITGRKQLEQQLDQVKATAGSDERYIET